MAERDLRKFTEDQAEESGSEGSGDGSDEDKEDNGEDLQGFIVDEAGDEEAPKKARAKGEDGDDESSSSGDGEGDAGELDEEDLQLLEDAGLDPAEVRKKRAKASDDSRPRKAAKQDNAAAELFGDEEDDLFGEKPPPARAETQVALHSRQEDDVFSDADEFDGDFIVGDDRAVKRRRKEEAAEHDISEEALQEIMDIFGDTSVLRPIDEFGDDSLVEGEQQSALVPVGDGDQQGPEQVLPLSLKKEKVMLDDAELEALDAPERWYKAYQTEPMLCDKDGVRRWTDEEHNCQTKWIYMEIFWSKWYQQDQAERAIRSVLELLHNQKLEPIYIVTQLSWQWANILARDDLWALFDKDQEWQRVWLLYHQLVEWKDRVQNQDALHEHIVAKISPHTFGLKNAEQELKDCHDWFSVMHPQEGFRNPDGPEDVSMWTAEAHKMNMIREHKFDEKLGVTESVDEMSLKIFGIIPLELGRNVEHGKQIFKPDPHDDMDSLKKILSKHIIPGTPERPSPFSTFQGVEEAITLYLSRLIANEPRVRKYVRGEFMKMCVISTKPTEAGKPVAHDAAQSFKKSYRAYHVANRPVSKFEDGDVLFLDILDAQRQGFLTMEYALVQIDDKKRFKWVMLGQDYNDVVRDRGKISEYIRKGRKRSTELTETKELMEKQRCEFLMPRLEVVAKNHEIESRLTATSGGKAKDCAQAIFHCATMEFPHDHLTAFMVQDPIYDFLQRMYCECEDQGEGQVYINPDEWNNVRKRILRRALRDELYPMLWAEVQAELTRKAEAAVCKQACENLCRIIDQKPFRVTQEELAQQRQENKWRMQDVHKGGEIDSDGESDNDFEWVREKKARLGGCNSVLVVVPNVISNSHMLTRDQKASEETCQVAFVNAYGDPVDMRVLFKDFHKPPPDPQRQQFRPVVPGSWQALVEEKRMEHRTIFRSLVIKHKPSIILLPVCNMQAQSLLQDVTAIIDEIDREDVGIFRMRPKLMYGDPSVARIISYHPRLIQEGAYRDCELAVQRIAISMARFTQDPLAETAWLWHENPDENGILKLRLHRLQLAVPRDRLHKALMQPLMETVARAGVHLNRLRLSGHLASTLPFVAGLGPRKSTMIRRCLNHAVTSRTDFGARIMRHLDRAKGAGPSGVVANCLPFFKICPDERDTWSIDKTDGFDRTRLAEPLRPWVTALCRKALQALQEHEEFQQKQDDSDSSDSEPVQKAAKEITGDPVTKALVQQAVDKKKGDNAFGKMLSEVNLDDLHEQAGPGVGPLPPDASLDVLLTEHLTPELLSPFDDTRQAFADMEDITACYLMLGEVEDNFSTGVLVHCTVRRDGEFGDKVVEDVTRSSVTTNCLPSMIPGSFKKYQRAQGPGQLQSTPIPGCNRKFESGDMVLARLMSIKAGPGKPYGLTLSVDMDEGMWVDRFPISQERGDHAYFVPIPTENWTKIELGPIDSSEKQKKEKLKTWVLRPRNIKHPNWTDADHTRAISIIASVPMGNVLFRPSRRHDLLVAMLKVHSTGPNELMDASKCFRTFDIFEKRDEKTIAKGFEIADELELDGVSYNDFDEIIARHMDPIMENLRMLQEHPRYGLREGEVTNLREVKAGIYRFSKEDRKTLHYCLLNNDDFVGHGQLVWTLAGHTPRVDFLEVSPQGFSLWNQNFATLKDMIAWFKKVGWRNSSACRKDWQETWSMKQKEIVAKRGKDAYEGVIQKTFVGFGGVATSATGLQTPGGYGAAAGTPTLYHSEAAAATPNGLRTPTGLSTPGMGAQVGSGYRTPDARNPSTPGGFATPIHSGMRTPMQPMQGQRRPTPMTPAAMLGSFGGAAPATPAGLGAMPATPAGLGGQVRQPYTPMVGGSQTPAAGYGRAPTTPAGYAPATPAGFAPATPGGFAPSTPAGPGGGRGFVPTTPGHAPATPAGGFVPMTPAMDNRGGGFVAPSTPAGFAPATPGMAPATPGGPAPMTPAMAPQTPAR